MTTLMSTPDPQVTGEPRLAARDLRVRFGDREVTHGTALKLHAGRITALVGESGSGKTVTAMALPRLQPGGAQVSGEALLRVGAETIDLLGSDAPLRRIRGGLIGTVFQEPTSAFNPVLSVGSQVEEALRWHTNLSRGDRRTRVLEQFREVGLTEAERIHSSFPHQLSGGQLQRAMIAMAVINRPAVLIADEPTTALDVTVQQGILALLTRLTEQLHLAVLLITHDMGIVWESADDVYVMKDGRIVEQGTVLDVFRSPQDPYTRTLLAAVPKLGAANRPQTAGPTPTVTRPPTADLRGITAAYRTGHPAVADIDLVVHPGRTLAVVGESGSGKTTIARVLSGQLRPQQGQVRLAGEDLWRLPGKRRRTALARLGYVFQDAGSALNPRRRVAWSIAEPLRVHHVRDPRPRVREVFAQVGLDADLLERYPHQLSGGQRQRVGIARALALRPGLLIADEPTSSLDVTVQAQILRLIRGLQAELGFACVFISHDLAVVQAIADDVLVLRHGRIVEQGPVASVLSEPRATYTRTLLAAVPRVDPSRRR